MSKVAVLMGGISAERSVSLSTGRGCMDALTRLGYDAIAIDPRNPDWIETLRACGAQTVLNVLHGEWGEDGRTQGALECLGLAYTHSGVLASALAMDKHKAKAVLAAAGIDVPKGRLMPRFEAARGHPMDPPYVVKPNAQGSSVGVFVVREGANRPPEQLLDPDWAFGAEVLVEEFIPGKELTVAVLGEASGPRGLAVTEILPVSGFYDFDSKYSEGGSRHVVPAEIPAEITQRALRIAEAAHAALGCRGITRSDLRYDPNSGRLVLLEVNTQPGMTPTSLAPEQAAFVGTSYDQLVDWIVKDASCPR